MGLSMSVRAKKKKRDLQDGVKFLAKGWTASGDRLKIWQLLGAARPLNYYTTISGLGGIAVGGSWRITCSQG